MAEPDQTHDDERDGDEHGRLLAHAKGYLPFLMIIINSENLDIQNEHKDKLRSLYEMVDAQRLSTSKLKSCQSVFCSLYAKYHKVLSEEQLRALNNTRHNVQSSSEDNNVSRSSDVESIPNESDQKLISKSESPTKISPLNVVEDKTLNEKQDSLEIDSKLDNESTLKKENSLKNDSKPDDELTLKKEYSLENDSKLDDESTLKKGNSLKNDGKLDDESTLKKEYSLDNDCKLDDKSTAKKENVDEFVLKFMVNTTVNELNKSNNVSSGSEFAKLIYNSWDVEQRKEICSRVVKGFNFNYMDVKLITNSIYNMVNGNNGGIEPPPLPPPEVMVMGLSEELVESNDLTSIDSINKCIVPKLPPEAPQPTSNCVPSIREKLKLEISKVHKIGLPSESKQQIISSLKPGTLRDLENSKSVSSLHMEFLRPIVKSNETFKPVTLTNVKKNEYIPTVNEIHIRDPRKKKNLSLNSENSVNPIQLSSTSPTNPQRLTPIPNVLNHSSELIPPILSIDMSLPFPPSTCESKQMEITSHCSKNNFPQHELSHSALSYCTGRVFNKLFNPSAQYQYGYNYTEFNYDNQQNNVHPYNSSNQTYVNSAHHDESRYFKSGSNNCHNENFKKRDPRLARSDPKSHEPTYRNFKEYREAKYGKEKSTKKESASSVYEPDRYRGRMLEKDRVKHTDKTTLKQTDLKNNSPYNTLGTISDIAASIKGFKIPKVKRVENVDSNKQKDLKIDKVANNTDKYRRSETPKDSNSDKYKKSETMSNADKCKNYASSKDSGTGSNRKTEIIKNVYSDKYRKTEAVKDNQITKELKAVSMDDKTENCLKTDGTKIKSLEIKKKEVTNDTKKDLQFEKTEDGTKKELKTENSSKPVANISSNSTEVNTIETKSKKLKKYSKEKEFKKIVKEAAASTKDDDLIGPRTRTRNLLKHNEEKLNNHSKPNNNEQNSVIKEYSPTNFDFFDKSHQNDNYESESLEEIGNNVISSTSKDPLEINSSTEVVCNKSQEEKMVSSSEVNSTNDLQSNDDNLELILRKEKLMAYINKCNNIDTLSKLLESPQIVNIIEDKVDNKSTLNDEQFDTKEQKKSKRKKKKRKKSSTISEKPLFNEKRNDLIDSLNEDNSKDENEDVIEGIKSYTEESNYDNGLNFNSNSDNMSTNQGESKSNNGKKSNPYGVFTVVKDKSNIEFRDLKIVLCNIESSGVVSKDVCNTNHPIQVSQNKCDEKLQSVISNPVMETTGKIISNKKRKFGPKIKNKTNSSLANTGEKPQILLESENSFKNSTVEKSSEETQSYCVVALPKQSSTETNGSVNSKSIKKPRSKTTELDKLHAYTSEMYDCDAILNIPNVRHCRTNKLVDYANNGIVFAKKSNASSLDQLQSYDHCNYEFDEDFESLESKSIKKPPSKLLKKKKNKNSNFKASKNNVMLMKKKRCVLSLVRKTKSNSKAKKRLTKQKLKLDNVVCSNEKAAEVLPKILTEHSFKDKSYFQSADTWLECKYCFYKDKGFNIVRHYVEQHREEEVLPSRLPKDCAESLINESLVENFGFLNSEDLKSTKCTLVNNVFTCVFCQLVISDIIQFYDHITNHTGEYRYKCKMCEQVYSRANELEKHILEHTDYDKTDGIAHLLHSSPTQKVFGYLCSFCYYVQLDYNNIVKHMEMRHNDEDKRFNGHWTVIRVSMSFENENHKYEVIDYKNLVGCLPPVPNQQTCQIISKIYNPEEITPIKQLVAEALNNLIGNAEHILLDKPPQEIHKAIHLSPKQANLSSHEKEFGISTVGFEVGYTMKENCEKLTVAELSCVLVDELLMFKCCVSSCLDHPFSTLNLREFIKHIDQSHQHTVWDRICTQCGLKVEKVSEECLVIKDALKHLLSHHLVLKSYEEYNMCPFENLIEEHNTSTSCQYNVENVTVKNESSSKPRIRVVPIDLMMPTATQPYKNIENKTTEQFTPEAVNENFAHLSQNASKKVLEESSDTTEQFIPETVNENIAQLTHNASDIVLEEPSGNETNSNQIMNYSFRIDKVMSLSAEDQTIKKIKKKALKKTMSSSDDNLNAELRIIITPENTKRDFQQKCCKAGHFVVNDRKSVCGSTYKLIDTEYNKCYSKQVKDFPIHTLKTRLALSEMMVLPRLLSLFKCMDRSCSKIFSDKCAFKAHMKVHFSNAEKKNKNQMNNIDYFKKCAYCYRTFDNEDSLAEHIAEQYTYCKYFCPYCFYRAYTPTHVLIHIDQTHSKAKFKVTNLEYDEYCNESQMEELKVVDFAKFVLPFVCNIGSCRFSCYLSEKFISHLMQEHQQCGQYCCYLCEMKNDTFFALQPNKMVDHLKIHGINKYQCVFCLFGTGSPYPMLIHLSMEHFEYNPICLERVIWENSYEENNLTDLKITKLTLPVDNGVLETINLPSGSGSISDILFQIPQKKDYECSDVITAAIQSARISKNVQIPDTIVINVPDRGQFTDTTNCVTDISNEFIMLDDMNNVNGKKDVAKIAMLSESGNSIRKPQSSDDDSVIIIDDEDEFLFNNEKNITLSGKRKRSVQSSNGLNKYKRLASPIILLDNLFDCKACGVNLQDSSSYQHHLSKCKHMLLNGLQCPFCVKTFKTHFHITEHIKLHGPERFSCSSCDFRAPSQRAIEHHMRVGHNIKTFDYVPVVSDLDDPERDDFVVHQDLTNSKKHCVKKIQYSCSLCEFVGRNYRSIVLHMKDSHLVDQLELNVLSDASSANEYTQHYIVKSTDGVIVSITSKPNEGVKRKHSGGNSDIASKKKINEKATTLENINDKVKPLYSMLFSPDTINDIPMTHVFSQPIGCLLCTYNTKVRSNIMMHLLGHKKGQDNTTKEIVNPVPSMGRSDLMFDKMINLAASSMEAMNTEKMKIFDLNKKIVEVTLKNYSNTEMIPRFVDKNERFICSICLGHFSNGDMLKTHVSVIHTHFSYYGCPHYPCDENENVFEISNIEYHLMHHGENLYGCQYCNYIDFNRSEMRTHMRTKHLLQVTNARQSNIIVIRQTKLEDDSLERSIQQDQYFEAEWICNLCYSDNKFTKNDIKSHILMVHKVSKMFKCPMCHFEHDDNNGKVFEDHYRVEHPSVAVKCLTVYEKVSHVQVQPNQPNYMYSPQYMSEQQALESIEPSIVPPACRGIPVESAGKMMYNKSRVGTKSPKAISKSSPISKQKSVDNFSILDSLGELTARGLFSCPRCNEFETADINIFHMHLCKDVNYKTWKCMNCFEISDSPKKMAWHVKKHGDGVKYQKIENSDKLNWVESVIKHQSALKHKFDQRTNVSHKEEQGKCVASDNNSLHLSLNKTNVENKNKVSGSQAVISCTTSYQKPTNIDVIDLLDDSDDE